MFLLRKKPEAFNNFKLGIIRIFIIKMVFFIVSFLSTNLLADAGYVYKGDLNDDGITDSIMSGPSSMIGNGGGPFLVSLSTPKGNFLQNVIG